MSVEPWRLLYANSARKDLRRLDPPVRARILSQLELLSQFGPGSELVKLKGRPGSRLRVGEWRVLVDLDTGNRTIKVERVLPRGRAYER